MNPLKTLTRRQWLSGALALAGLSMAGPAHAKTYFRRIPLMYIAALGPENARSGNNAQTWGLWRRDPGPIGVWLRLYQTLRKAGNIAPAGWRFDIDDWWLDENGLIMKAPDFPMPAGRFLVTNGEEHIAILTVHQPDADGNQAWELGSDKTLANVTSNVDDIIITANGQVTINNLNSANDVTITSQNSNIESGTINAGELVIFEIIGDRRSKGQSSC